MKGYDFHRQKPIDEYILDFFCYELMLGIEVDGYTHLEEETRKKDQKKEESMNSLGITVLRFTDDEVFKSIDRVIQTIRLFIETFEKQNGINNSLSFFKRDTSSMDKPVSFLKEESVTTLTHPYPSQEGKETTRLPFQESDNNNINTPLSLSRGE